MNKNVGRGAAAAQGGGGGGLPIPQQQDIPHRVLIFHDAENCPIPATYRGSPRDLYDRVMRTLMETVTGRTDVNIREIQNVHWSFVLHYDRDQASPNRLAYLPSEQFFNEMISMPHIFHIDPGAQEDAVDRKIQKDIDNFWDDPRAGTLIVLLSGDSDYSPHLDRLRRLDGKERPTIVVFHSSKSRILPKAADFTIPWSTIIDPERNILSLKIVGLPPDWEHKDLVAAATSLTQLVGVSMRIQKINPPGAGKPTSMGFGTVVDDASGSVRTQLVGKTFPYNVSGVKYFITIREAKLSHFRISCIPPSWSCDKLKGYTSGNYGVDLEFVGDFEANGSTGGKSILAYADISSADIEAAANALDGERPRVDQGRFIIEYKKVDPPSFGGSGGGAAAGKGDGGGSEDNSMDSGSQKVIESERISISNWDLQYWLAFKESTIQDKVEEFGGDVEIRFRRVPHRSNLPPQIDEVYFVGPQSGVRQVCDWFKAYVSEEDLLSQAFNFPTSDKKNLSDLIFKAVKQQRNECWRILRDRASGDDDGDNDDDDAGSGEGSAAATAPQRRGKQSRLFIRDLDTSSGLQVVVIGPTSDQVIFDMIVSRFSNLRSEEVPLSVDAFALFSPKNTLCQEVPDLHVAFLSQDSRTIFLFGTQGAIEEAKKIIRQQSARLELEQTAIVAPNSELALAISGSDFVDSELCGEVKQAFERAFSQHQDGIATLRFPFFGPLMKGGAKVPDNTVALVTCPSTMVANVKRFFGVLMQQLAGHIVRDSFSLTRAETQFLENGNQVSMLKKTSGVSIEFLDAVGSIPGPQQQLQQPPPLLGGAPGVFRARIGRGMTVETLSKSWELSRAEAIVNSSNALLAAGKAGISKDIFDACGPAIVSECEAEVVKANGSIKVGTCAHTSAGSMSSQGFRFVIHAVAPQCKTGDDQERYWLRSTILSCLNKALDLGIQRLAMPLIGCGVFGWNKEVVSNEIVRTFREWVNQRNPENFTVVVVSIFPESILTFEQVLQQTWSEQTDSSPGALAAVSICPSAPCICQLEGFSPFVKKVKKQLLDILQANKRVIEYLVPKGYVSWTVLCKQIQEIADFSSATLIEESKARRLVKLEVLGDTSALLHELTQKINTTLADATKVPDFWEPMDKYDNGVKIVTLDPSNPDHEKEYKTVEDRFKWGVVNVVRNFHSNISIERIDRVQNQLLWERYIEVRYRIAECNDGDANEMDLIHGTSQKYPLEVATSHSGMNMLYSGQRHFGRAAYFAEDTYCFHTGYRTRLENGSSQLMLCKVAAGRVDQRNRCLPEDQNIRHPPQGFDSIRGPVCETPLCFALMTYQLNQSYPAYIITYKAPDC